MNNKKTTQITRIVAAVLAAILLLSVLISGLSIFVSAADDTADVKHVIVYKQNESNNALSGTMQDGNKYAVKIQYTQTGVPLDTQVPYKGKNIKVDIDASCMLYTTSTSTAELVVDSVENGVASVSLYINHVVFKKKGGNLDISAKVLNNVGDELYTPRIAGVVVPDEYIPGGSGGSGGTDDDITYTPDIKVENVIALDSKGNRIDEVTKDTPPFSLEIVYADMGLHNADADDLKSGDMQAFLTDTSGLAAKVSNKGTVRLVSSSWDYPRFRVNFSNITFDGLSNKVNFEVYYIFDTLDNPVKGQGAGSLYAAKTDKDESEDDKMGVAIPKIIINQYSYGQEAIVAGSEFKLDFSILNTSADTPLENIVVTLTPASNEAATKGPGLIVASSSNTIYVPQLEAGASQTYSVAFQARPDAEVTSHLINIKFSYEYIDVKLKSRERVPDLSESIAIPVSQIDRFAVDPITEAPYAVVGEEAYLTVNFINRGKSTTYNVSGVVKIDPSVTVPTQHFGNLEAGKSDSLDFYLTPTQPGQFEGEVVIQYEDENSNTREIAVPFSLTVEEPYYPPMDLEPPPDQTEDAPKGPGLLTILLCVAGAIAIAVPIALYLIKRVKAKGSEDFDENF